MGDISENRIYKLYIYLYCIDFNIHSSYFLPGMHERYGYVYEILAILLMVYDKRTMFLSIALQLCTVITYSSYLFQKGYNVTIMSIINFAIYLIYVWYYIVRLKKSIKDC